MKYASQEIELTPDQRRMINEKILYLIESNTLQENGFTCEDVYNAYTGDGGLHGLKRRDYNSYHDYSEAKKEIENGQFFTPANVCELVVSSLGLSHTDLVADLTCGMGNFFNFVPVESNAYGCELDSKAYKVACCLYPEANLDLGDIRTYRPELRFDYVVGNPPFHLRWHTEKGDYWSQIYYCVKAAELLKPLGILALVVPQSFLADTFSDSTMIREMERRYSFLGQIMLPGDTFYRMGVHQFPMSTLFLSATDSE